MFRATMCLSSVETTVFVRHLVLAILCGWLSGMQGGIHPAYQNKKCQVSHKHSCFSWWWAHSGPKHVEIDKYTKNKLCTKLALFTRCKKLYMTSNYDVVKLLNFTIAGSFVCCLKSIWLFSFGSDDSVTDGWMQFDPFLSFRSSNIFRGWKGE